MKKRYEELVKIGYPMSNLRYVVSVNNYILNEEGKPSNNSVNIDSELEPDTITVLKMAGLQNRANKEIS